ncbi:uncharacterized protein LOC143275459 [Babylonia areolata]|uniref:uncharacterized protein LOC143275459 n=1 Tax=Babylonia areolata TaxID=304850 RepID=UPI003FD546E9
MGGCLGREEREPVNNLIIDVQQILADDAWEEFVDTSRRKCKRLRIKRSDYVIEVPMNYYHFEVTDQKFQKKKRLPSLRSNDSADKGQSSQVQAKRASPDQVGLKTEFRNDTEKDQTYNFRMEKTRTATVQVNYQTGFSIGGSVSFMLGVPKVLPDGEISAEVNATYEVTNSRGQTFEETMTTEATSQIVVPCSSHCTAHVVMEERRLLADFTVWVMMHMPEKAAVVTIKNRAGRVVFLKQINNLRQIFPEHTHIAAEDGRSKRTDAVQFVIHGFVDGMQLSNHYINLKSRKLPSGGKASKRQTPKGGWAQDAEKRDQDDDDEFPDLQEMGFKPQRLPEN